jgi:ATP-dependent RNA helicase DeaD
MSDWEQGDRAGRAEPTRHRVGRTTRMGAAGKAFTFVERSQGEELTRVEMLINMVIPQATVEGFEPTPPPRDWTEHPPGREPKEMAIGALDRPDGAAPDAPTVELPPPPRRTIGSKQPVRRRKLRR